MALLTHKAETASIITKKEIDAEQKKKSNELHKRLNARLLKKGEVAQEETQITQKEQIKKTQKIA